ncbi:MAG: DUF433 domain-containing protein [Phycisphaeraceae bacterium]|nr:DUF433 domain-containing protein [Phycisphaeraceae bacterium]
MTKPPNPRIEIDPRKCHGRPVIRGTRVPAALRSEASPAE